MSPENFRVDREGKIHTFAAIDRSLVWRTLFGMLLSGLTGLLTACSTQENSPPRAGDIPGLPAGLMTCKQGSMKESLCPPIRLTIPNSMP
jgi:hypothetical protein